MGGYPGSTECCRHTCSISGDCPPPPPSWPVNFCNILACLLHRPTCLITYHTLRIMVVMAFAQQIDGVLQLAEGQDVYQLLGSPYQDLWLHWLDEGNEAYKQQAKNSNQERLDFVRSVVAAAAASNTAASQSGSAEPTDNAASANTQELPKVSAKLTGWC